jgi:hypothetical protein
MTRFQTFFFFLLYIFSSHLALANLGQTYQELETKHGKTFFSRRISDHVNTVAYEETNGVSFYFLFDDKVEMYGIRINSGLLSSKEVKDILENNKSSEDSFWKILKQPGDESIKVYYLCKGDTRYATCLENQVVVMSKTGLTFMHDNKDTFNKFLEDTKNWVTGLVHEKLDDTFLEMPDDVIEVGIIDPKQAVLLAHEKRVKGYKDYSFPYLFGTMWYRTNPKDYMQWARTLTSDEFEEANKCTFETIDNLENQKAEEYVKNEMAHGSKRILALFNIGFRKSQADPGEAMKWASSFPQDDDGYLSAISSVSVFSSRKVPSDVLDWVISLSDKIPEYDSQDKPCTALYIPLTLVYKKDPSKALTRALDIKNEKIKAIECYRLAKLMASDDKDAFFRFLATVKRKADKNLYFPAFIEVFNKGVFSDYKDIATSFTMNDISPFDEDQTNKALQVAFPYLFERWFKDRPAECIDFIRSVKTSTEKGAILKTHVLTSFMGGEDPYLNINKISSGQ